jgi:competence protein ComGC
MSRFNKKLKSEKGAAIVELILIIVVMVGLVLLFREQITALVTDLFGRILEEAGRI